MEYQIGNTKESLQANIKVDAETGIVRIDGKKVYDCEKHELEYAFLRLMESIVRDIIKKELQ